MRTEIRDYTRCVETVCSGWHATAFVSHISPCARSDRSIQLIHESSFKRCSYVRDRQYVPGKLYKEHALLHSSLVAYRAVHDKAVKGRGIAAGF